MSAVTERALNLAHLLLNEDHDHIECLQALESGKGSFYRTPEAMEETDCGELIEDLSLRAHEAGEACRAAGMTALADCCFLIDGVLRSAFRVPRQRMVEVIASLSRLTTAGRAALDVAEDAAQANAEIQHEEAAA